MREPPPDLDAIRAAFEPHGLFLRGTLAFDGGEEAPRLDDGRRAGSLVLVGNVGGSLWPAFSRWRAGRPDGGGENPLDDWSKAVIRPVAASAGATVWFPSDPPWQPFQRWAMRAEGLKPSPLGILVHPVYGLWHGYRAALGFAAAAGEPSPPAGPHPCDTCASKPCLSTCPVGAVQPAHFDVPACRAYLRTAAGRASCMRDGCIARAACPVGAAYRYPEAQLGFHMAALKL